MKIIGLTGNSGSGKGTVSLIMANMGALVLDCDKIAHKNMEKGGAAYDEIIGAFPFAVDDKGNIDRKKLGAEVFGNRESLRRLNRITHKYIREYTENAISINRDKYEYIVIDAPLLTEAGLEKLCDEVWLVYADEKTRLERVVKRDKITAEEALMRFKNQTPAEELMKYADLVIENNGDLDKLKKQIYERVGK